MGFSFISLVTERPRFWDPVNNLVAFSSSVDILSVHSALVAAADIVQGRFRNASFLIETSSQDTIEAMHMLEDAFEVSVASSLFCVPFRERLRLADPEVAMTNFGTYTRVFDALRGGDGEETLDIDELWEHLFEQEGLITFRLVLGQE